MRQLLIVGLDPGTTAGYAVLDTAGRLLKTRSSKQLDLNKIIEELVELGSILAIGTDKGKTPGMIEKAAAATGAKVITPEEDLQVAEKEGLTDNMPASNVHEKDALAAAVYAYKELVPLLQRIRKVLENEGKMQFLMEVTEKVVISGRNIKDALREAEKHEEAEKPKPITIAEEKPKIDDWTMIALKRLEKENEILRSYNKKLLDEIRLLYKKARKNGSASQKGGSEKEKNHQILVSRMQAIITQKEAHESELMGQIRLLEDMANSGELIAKKAKNLGFGEIEKINIRQGGIILVEDANNYSEKALELLQKSNPTILSRNEPSPNVKRLLQSAGVTAIPANGIILMETQKHAAADRKKLAEAIKKLAAQNVLNIIETYKEKRKTLI